MQGTKIIKVTSVGIAALGEMFVFQDGDKSIVEPLPYLVHVVYIDLSDNNRIIKLIHLN